MRASWPGPRGEAQPAPPGRPGAEGHGDLGASAQHGHASTLPVTLTPRDNPLDVVLDFLLRHGRGVDGHEAGAAVPLER
eukprot:11181050-Alexandrium_andersonii.AAC.1